MGLSTMDISSRRIIVVTRRQLSRRMVITRTPSERVACTHTAKFHCAKECDCALDGEPSDFLVLCVGCCSLLVLQIVCPVQGRPSHCDERAVVLCNIGQDGFDHAFSNLLSSAIRSHTDVVHKEFRASAKAVLPYRSLLARRWILGLRAKHTAAAGDRLGHFDQGTRKLVLVTLEIRVD
jgi:hypothetical protein